MEGAPPERNVTVEANIIYSPQQLSPETLKRNFVNREAQLDLMLNRIKNAENSGSLAHTLFVGARGSGKTFLIMMAYHKAKEGYGFGEHYRISLLPEEPYGIISFETLMDAIAANREPAYENESKGAALTVTFIENFDRILEVLGVEGQKSLRAYIERNRNLLLIATAQRLSQDRFDQAAPFYGFFDVINLSAFTTEEITNMLVRKAEADGNASLVTRLKQPDTQARLAALEQVTGGLPRIWSIFSFGLVIENLPDMVGLMLEKLDYLTPLYQEMLWRLSPNERRAVMVLINSDGALTVKSLAKSAGIDQKSLGTTLRTLTPGWVIPREGRMMQYVDKRSTYYQLAEPLIRIVTQMKTGKGKPIKTVVDFLAAWFSRDELEKYSFLYFDDKNQNLEITATNIDEAAKEAASPPYRLRESMLTGRPHIHDDERYPMRSDEALVREYLAVDKALGTLQNAGSSEEVLALPTAVTNLLEAQLHTTSCALMRIELALLGIRNGGSDECLRNAVAAVSAKENEFSLRSEEEKTAQLIIACIRLLLRQDKAGFRALDFALSMGERELENAQWEIIARTANCHTHYLKPDIVAKLLSHAAPYFPESDLASIVRFCLRQPYGCSGEIIVFEALAARLSHSPVTNIPSTEDSRMLSSEKHPVRELDKLLVTIKKNYDFSGLEWLSVRAEIADLRRVRCDAKKAKEELKIILREVDQYPDADLEMRTQITTNFAAALYSTGDGEGAEKLLKKCLSDVEAAFGQDHPNVIACRANSLLFRKGNSRPTISEYQSLVDDSVRVFGATHRNTLELQNRLNNYQAFTSRMAPRAPS